MVAGRTTARALVEACLARIDDPDGQGRVAFVSVNREAALAAADAMDTLRAAGLAPSPFAGIPISVKDLFDMAGEATAAGSRVLADAPPAVADATAVARLRAAGFLVIGRTNMTEFAFSGLGLNPHHGTPLSPSFNGEKRIAGGSSSGAAVSVVEGMALGAIGTDTGGSCRIPAAFCGLVGFKPTAGAVPTDGVLPLSTTLDSVGPIARSVDCARILFDVMAGRSVEAVARLWVPGRDAGGMRLAVPRSLVLDGMDKHVARAFEAALSRLSDAGATFTSIELPELAEIAAMNARGGFAAAEAFALHRRWIETRGALYDPRVLSRIRRGAEQSAADYIDLLAARRSFVRAVTRRIEAYDAVVFPTVPIVAPTLESLEADDAAYAAANLLVLRNSSVVNLADGCGVSIPLREDDGRSIGLTLFAARGKDEALLAVAAGLERALAD